MFKRRSGLAWSVDTEDTRGVQLGNIDRHVERLKEQLERRFVSESLTALWRKQVEEAELWRAKVGSKELAARLAGRKGEQQLTEVSVGEYERMREAQACEPVLVCELENATQLWWFKDAYYEAHDDLSAEDVDALVHEQVNRKRIQLEKAHALKAMREQLDSKVKRQPIPQEVKVAVWQRDQGRCVECSSQSELEYDHVIPIAMGGSNTERNLQLLCAVCNRRKGATLG